MIPTNPILTKLRLIAERQKRVHQLTIEVECEARHKYEKVWLDYCRACRTAGYCASCEKPLNECDCVVLGISTYAYSA